MFLKNFNLTALKSPLPLSPSDPSLAIKLASCDARGQGTIFPTCMPLIHFIQKSDILLNYFSPIFRQKSCNLGYNQ